MEYNFIINYLILGFPSRSIKASGGIHIYRDFYVISVHIIKFSNKIINFKVIHCCKIKEHTIMQRLYNIFWSGWSLKQLFLKTWCESFNFITFINTSDVDRYDGLTCSQNIIPWKLKTGGERKCSLSSEFSQKALQLDELH